MSTQSEMVLLDGETGSTPIILYVTVETIKVSPQISLVCSSLIVTVFSVSVNGLTCLLSNEETCLN